ncbi:MAG TPA: Type 1 glutamine amidotransferase-like domain-containing protein [Acidimicrobiales bacterium]|nr:Type 1 glutamine amidotransferase-like domain-containing protein [Acidimicrobiales bacterium]
MAGDAGPVALVGSGEFLAVMEAVDAGLLEGRPRRAVVLPTAAAREGDERVAYWLELGRTHYEAMGVEPVLLDVRTRKDADDPDTVARVEGAGLVYLSGGDPHHLSNTMRSSALWRAIVAAWHGGAALAGCSAGAMALTAGAPDNLRPTGAAAREAPERPGVANGLGLVGGLAVIPHFDQMERWRPGALAWFASWQPPRTALVGVEEETALVWTGDRWQVQGAGAVWVLGPSGRDRFGAGAEVPLAGTGLSASAPSGPS